MRLLLDYISLTEQRQRIIHGIWVPKTPRQQGECCLIESFPWGQPNRSLVNKKGREALQIILGIYSLTLWNDSPERTKEEVLEVIDKAIALIEVTETE